MPALAQLQFFYTHYI